MRVYAIAVVLVALFFELKASNGTNNGNFDKEISSSDLQKHLDIIASDALEGRNTGSQGQQMAAEYISNHFRNIGLDPIVNTPIGTSYYQQVDLQQVVLNTATISNGESSLDFIRDFYCYSTYRQNGITLETAFVGYGIEGETLNEYEGISLEGKAAIILWGEPQNENGTFLLSGNGEPSAWSGDYSRAKKSRIAKRRGAEEVIFILPEEIYQEKIGSNNSSVFSKKLLLPDSRDLNKSGSSWSGIFVNEIKFENVSGINSKMLEKYKSSLLKNKISPITTSRKLTIQTDYRSESIYTQNVLGFLKGSDSLSGTIVITAHYDHIGKDEEGIYNGADDDGSGTVSVLEIAESFAKARDAGILPKKNILFMTVTGEEKGLLGSRYYTDFNPIIPLEDIVCNLNIDMVGRVDDDHLDNENYVYTIGSDRLSTQLKELQEEVNQKTEKLVLDYEFDKLDDPNNFYKRSDHYNFAKNDIPVIFFFNGTHDDYHQHTDTVEKIRFDIMEKRARLIYNIAFEIGNMDERFVIDNKDSEPDAE